MPGGKHDNMRLYGPEEAALVMQLVKEHSPRWTHIAKLLSEATNQERTAASVRNYYKRFCASKEMANSITTKKLNRCQMCGQVKRGHICQPSALTYAPPAPPATPATQSTETAEPASAPSLLLNLQSSGEEEMPPLAPASLAAASLLEILTPGTPTLSALNTSGPLTAGPLSVSGFWKTGSPGSLGLGSLNAAAAAVNEPFAFSRAFPRPSSLRPTSASIEQMQEQVALVREAAAHAPMQVERDRPLDAVQGDGRLPALCQEVEADKDEEATEVDASRGTSRAPSPPLSCEAQPVLAASVVCA